MNISSKRERISIVIALVLTMLFISTSTSFAINDSRPALKKNKGNRDLILKVQAENKLNVDGVFGPATQQALNGQITVKNDRIPNSVAGDNTFITINKDKKILTLYKKGKTVGRYPVALGKSSTPTPSYRWTVSNKAINPYWGGMGGKKKPIKGGAPNNPLGKRWLGLSGGGYRGYGIHGNASRNSIGKYISAGCIRMINSDVESIYPNIPVGTKVWIGSEKELASWGIGFNQGDTVFKGNKPKPKPIDPNIVKAKGGIIDIQIDRDVKKVQSYNIKDNNYIKLRDIAALLDNTNDEFNIKWNSSEKIIEISNDEYDFIGEELNLSTKFSSTARISSAKIKYNNKDYKLNTYNINGFNYVQLRDVMNILNVRVAYNNTKRLPIILSDEGIQIVDSKESLINIDGTNYLIEAYNIKDTNYVKLRDVAYLFNNTENPFEVDWDNDTKMIKITPGIYSIVGQEGDFKESKKSIAYLNRPNLMVIDELREVESYYINGNNFMKLRDIIDILGSEVDYNNETQTIEVKTKPMITNILDILQDSVENFFK